MVMFKRRRGEMSCACTTDPYVVGLEEEGIMLALARSLHFLGRCEVQGLSQCPRGAKQEHPGMAATTADIISDVSILHDLIDDQL